MAIILVLLAFILCWIWIELAVFITNRLVIVNSSKIIKKKFIWYLRFIAISLFLISFIYMYFFQKTDFQKAIEYCLGIIK
tara:strand:- start:331 stop:570 length:240 start_codon:yes stop_codon:yes gene_type:complete